MSFRIMDLMVDVTLSAAEPGCPNSGTPGEDKGCPNSGPGTHREPGCPNSGGPTVGCPPKDGPGEGKSPHKLSTRTWSAGSFSDLLVQLRESLGAQA